MVNHQLIKPVFTGKEVLVVGRREDNKKVIIHDSTHDSYLYVKEDEYIDATDPRIIAIEYADGRNKHDWIPFPTEGTLHGERVKRLFVSNPNDVTELRDDFKDAMEADVKYKRRYIIDRGITSGFNEKLEPVNFSMPPFICVLDIEVYSKRKISIQKMKRLAKNSIVMIGFRFGDKKKPIQLVLDKEQKRRGVFEEHDRVILYFRSEIELLIYFWKILKQGFPDVLTGWNVDFDIEYIKNRCKVLIKTLKTSRKGNKLLMELKLLFDENFLQYILVFDLMNSYDQLYEPVRKGLKFVELEEGLTRKYDVTGKSFSKVYIENQLHSEYYNLEDVNNTWGINNIRNVIQFFWENKNFVGLEDLTGARFFSRLVDTITLRIARGRYALPSAPQYTEEERAAIKKFKGAAVLETLIGIHDNVGTFDFTRFYPTIMLIKKKLIGFLKDLVPQVVEHVWKARDVVEEKLKQLIPNTDEYKDMYAKFMSRKFLLNAVYGQVGRPYYRLYDRKKAGMITAYCRTGLKILKKVAIELGYKVLAGDTDSIFIRILEDIKATVKELVKEGENLADKFNYVLQKIFKTKMLRVELETIWRPICFVEKKKTEDPAKKKYFGREVWRKGVDLTAIGKEEIKSKGMASVKRDTSKLTKIVQERLYHYILNNQLPKALPYLTEVYRKSKEGKFSIDAIVIGKQLSRNLKKYKSNVEYVRGSKYANKYIYKSTIMGAGVRAFMIFISKVLDPELPQTDVIALESPEEEFDRTKFRIDYRKTMARTLEMPLDKILKLAGIDWNKVRGQADISVLME